MRTNSLHDLIAPDINGLIIERLGAYPPAVREVAIRAVQLSETLPESAVADQLLALVRRLARPQDGGSR